MTYYGTDDELKAYLRSYRYDLILDDDDDDVADDDESDLDIISFVKDRAQAKVDWLYPDMTDTEKKEPFLVFAAYFAIIRCNIAVEDGHQSEYDFWMKQVEQERLITVGLQYNPNEQPTENHLTNILRDPETDPI